VGVNEDRHSVAIGGAEDLLHLHEV
jgi:hypothetical protein